jgi:hypothetical protein
MQNIPTQKRGIIWLICSLPLLGITGFGAFIYGIKLIVEFFKGVYTLFLLPSSIQNDVYIFIGLLCICLLALSGVCYGAMQIIASHKKYSFKKTRILTVILVAASTLIVYSYLWSIEPVSSKTPSDIKNGISFLKLR